MADYDTDYESTLERMQGRIDGDISKGEGSLVGFALAPAAAEIEELHNDIEVADLNGSPLTCDRDHLIQFGKSNNIPIKTATNAVWLAQFNVDFELGERFEAGELTYISTEKVADGKYYLECEQSGGEGNTKPEDELLPIEYIDDYESGELIELIKEATDDEETETFRERYLSERKQEVSMSGNRASYKKTITALTGVAGVKLERVTATYKRINAYILSSTWGKPSNEVVTYVQEKIDPLGKQGDGEGEAPFFHVVNIYPVEETKVDIKATFELQAGVSFADIVTDLQTAVDEYFIDLNKTWETESYLIVRALKIAEKMAAVAGVVDIKNLLLNGVSDNVTLGAHAIPVRGVIENAN